MTHPVQIKRDCKIKKICSQREIPHSRRGEVSMGRGSVPVSLDKKKSIDSLKKIAPLSSYFFLIIKFFFIILYVYQNKYYPLKLVIL